MMKSYSYTTQDIGGNAGSVVRRGYSWKYIDEYQSVDACCVAATGSLSDT